MRDPVETYFATLRDIRASGAGVAETSFYPALAELLTSVGSKLKPKVTAIINLKNTGAGIPDGGLFTASQLKGWEPGVDPLAGQLPARGAIEVKSPAEDALVTAASEQVARYVERYGLVLVTNLRDFVLVGKSADGTSTRVLETLRLSETESGFWAKVQQPQKYAGEAEEGLTSSFAACCSTTHHSRTRRISRGSWRATRAPLVCAWSRSTNSPRSTHSARS